MYCALSIYTIMFGFWFVNINTSQNKWEHNTDIWDDNTLENIWYIGTTDTRTSVWKTSKDEDLDWNYWNSIIIYREDRIQI